MKDRRTRMVNRFLDKINSLLGPIRAGEEGVVLVATKATGAFLKGLAVFVNNPSDQFSGIDICHKTGMKSGTVYPLLIKMEENGWLESEWEDIDPRKEGRPKRHFYKITRGGLIHGTKLLEKHRPPIAKPEGHETPILT
jgi:PadR family transcriptional regulator, regulatory protein PadR